MGRLSKALCCSSLALGTNTGGEVGGVMTSSSCSEQKKRTKFLQDQFDKDIVKNLFIDEHICDVSYFLMGNFAVKLWENLVQEFDCALYSCRTDFEACCLCPCLKHLYMCMTKKLIQRRTMQVPQRRPLAHVSVTKIFLVSFCVLVFAHFMIVSFMLSCEGNKVNKYYCHCYKNSSQYQTFQTLYENKRMGDLRLHLICVFIFGCICIICQ